MRSEFVVADVTLAGGTQARITIPGPGDLTDLLELMEYHDWIACQDHAFDAKGEDQGPSRQALIRVKGVQAVSIVKESRHEA